MNLVEKLLQSGAVVKSHVSEVEQSSKAGLLYVKNRAILELDNYHFTFGFSGKLNKRDSNNFVWILKNMSLLSVTELSATRALIFSKKGINLDVSSLYLDGKIYTTETPLVMSSSAYEVAMDLKYTVSISGISKQVQNQLNLLGFKHAFDLKPMLKEPNLVQLLLDKDAKVIRELNYYKEREKVSGAMWNGTLELEHQGYRYTFKLWHHHHYDEDMTVEEVYREMRLQYVRDLSKEPPKLFGMDNSMKDFFDAYHHCITSRDCILLNRKGLIHYPEDIQINIIDAVVPSIKLFGLSEKYKQQVEAAGFEVLVSNIM